MRIRECWGSGWEYTAQMLWSTLPCPADAFHQFDCDDYDMYDYYDHYDYDDDDDKSACDFVPLTKARATRSHAAAKQTTDCHLKNFIFFIYFVLFGKSKKNTQAHGSNWFETWVLHSLANCFPGFQVHVWKPSDYDYCDDHRVIIIIMLIAMIWTTSNYWKWFLPNEARFKWSSYSPLKVLNSGGGAKKSTVTVMHFLIQQHSQRSLIFILHHVSI